MQIGQVISGKYRLLRLLGDGGMGSVYEAQHEVLGTRVAIKVLHQDLVQKPGLVDRFLREARVSAQIQNSHVVRVLDVDRTADGAAYIVMELLSGEELSAVLHRERRLPLPTAVDFATQILDALSAAHALGVVHRDLKPENVFVTMQEGRALLRLIDFGIAKARPLNDAPNLTVTGTLMGTPEYMAPEQAHSADKADARSDIYAVGVMLYEMLSGTRPVDGADPRVVAMKVERGEVKALIHVLPDVPRDLAGLVHRAMAPRPELRFGSAGEMRQALGAVVRGQRVQSQTPRPQTSGTLLGEPPGSADAGLGTVEPATTRAEVTAATGHGAAPAYGPPAQQAASVQPWAPSVQPYPGGTPGRPVSTHPGGRGRRGGGAVWLFLGAAVVVGGGVAVAFAVSNARGGGGSPPPPQASPVVTGARSSGPEPSASPVVDPTIPALPAATHEPPLSIAPATHAPDRPHPSASASGSAAPPASTPSPPFTVPPFELPSGFPPIVNPFPMPGGSGVPPVFTLPTAFPQFPGSPLPAPPPSAPSH